MTDSEVVDLRAAALALRDMFQAALDSTGHLPGATARWETIRTALQLDDLVVGELDSSDGNAVSNPSTSGPFLAGHSSDDAAPRRALDAVFLLRDLLRHKDPYKRLQEGDLASWEAYLLAEYEGDMSHPERRRVAEIAMIEACLVAIDPALRFRRAGIPLRSGRPTTQPGPYIIATNSYYETFLFKSTASSVKELLNDGDFVMRLNRTWIDPNIYMDYPVGAIASIHHDDDEDREPGYEEELFPTYVSEGALQRFDAVQALGRDPILEDFREFYVSGPNIFDSDEEIPAPGIPDSAPASTAEVEAWLDRHAGQTVGETFTFKDLGDWLKSDPLRGVTLLRAAQTLVQMANRPDSPIIKNGSGYMAARNMPGGLLIVDTRGPARIAGMPFGPGPFEAWLVFVAKQLSEPVQLHEIMFWLRTSPFGEVDEIQVIQAMSEILHRQDPKFAQDGNGGFALIENRTTDHRRF